MGVDCVTPGKAHYEWLVLYIYSPLWMSVMGVIILCELYVYFEAVHYVVLGLALATTGIVLPLLFPCPCEQALPWSQRHWVHANIWIAILSFMGNHFLTHYFYRVLHCRYHVPTAGGRYTVNDVPVSMHLLTHAYFSTYFVFGNVLFRRIRKAVPSPVVWLGIVPVVAFVTASLETLSVVSFPLYSYPDLSTMLTYGSSFYSLFLGSCYIMFPRVSAAWPLSRTAIEALGTSMLIFLLYDLWRLNMPPLSPDLLPASAVPSPDCSGCHAPPPY
mmetsp:Transcript_30662/g.85889  ORF Transcript_30662/g.85889 Transcript_30662/m.85889 type:complete len:273 (+) Transcript_30662:189-1007(+)